MVNRPIGKVQLQIPLSKIPSLMNGNQGKVELAEYSSAHVGVVGVVGVIEHLETAVIVV
jgi:hypothetical protein